jgi:hypothetical protein
VRRWPCATPRAGTFARAGKNIFILERFGRRLAYDAQSGCVGGCGVVTRGPPSDSNIQRKSPRRISPRGLLKILR